LLLKLQPRALTRTSSHNYQCWLTIPDHLARMTALQVTTELTSALKGDPNAAYVTQQGRLPGTINHKPGKGCLVALLHSQVTFLEERIFLQLTSNQKVPAQERALVVRGKKRPFPGDSIDRSAEDFKMCCLYFEAHPAATAAEALVTLAGNFQADRKLGQAYYQNRTVQKAKVRVASRRGEKDCGSLGVCGVLVPNLVEHRVGTAGKECGSLGTSRQ